eukprot:12425406-Karenia_brevis.AAC.1
MICRASGLPTPAVWDVLRFAGHVRDNDGGILLIANSLPELARAKVVAEAERGSNVVANRDT